LIEAVSQASDDLAFFILGLGVGMLVTILLLHKYEKL
jgi:hypothetical protein